MAKRKTWAEMDKNEIPFEQLRAAFEIYNRTTNKSPRTVAWYNDKLNLFKRFLGPDAVLADLTVPNVRAFIADLQGRESRHANNSYFKNKEGPLSSSYIQGFARALRAFASWLYEDGYTETNALKNLKPPKVQGKVVDVLSDEEVSRLLKAFNRNESYGARNYAAVITMLDCGLRATELRELKLEDAHIEQGYLKILGKGNKERLVPLGQASQEALLRWRDRFRAVFEPATDHLFLGADGDLLTMNALEQMVTKAGRRQGIDRLHCHLLRHTFATNYLVKQVGDPLRLQQILGHRSLEMVRRYVAMASVQQSLIERRASPIDLILNQEQPRLRPTQPAKRPRIALVSGR
jgi:integrase/recombinase XerC/integrase/recombinase XerD